MDFRTRIVESLQETIAERHLGGMLLFKPENSTYVTGYFPGGFMTGPVVTVVPIEGEPMLVTNFYEEEFIRSLS